MSDIYDVIENQKPGEKEAVNTNRNAGKLSKEEYKERKKAERQGVYDMIDEALEQIQGGGEEFKDYLDTQSRLDRYTVANTLAIMSQRDNVTQLKDYDSWKEKGIYIKRNENHIKILEPYDYVTPDGNSGTGYNVKHVFDISQTTARPKVRSNHVSDEMVLLKALIDNAPVPLKVVEQLSQGNGAYYDHENDVINIQAGLEPADFFKSVSRELAHAEIAAAEGTYDRVDLAFHADCTSYMLCKKYGIDTGELSISDMPEAMKAKEPREFRAELSKMRDSMRQINTRMSISLEQQKAAKEKDRERQDR